jgi:tetratricopeptide (TPR) repeat protein
MVPIRGFRLAGALVGLMAPLLAAGAGPNQNSSLINHKSQYAPYWSSRLAAPEPGDHPEASLALKRLIRKVQAMTLEDKGPALPAVPEPVGDPSPVTRDPGHVGTTHASGTPSSVPVTSHGSRATNDEATTVRAEPVSPAAPETATTVSPKARRILEDLRRNPSRVQDPLEVAELLFLSGRPTDAAAFYEEALRRAGTQDAAAGDACAWILFQLGNCLRQTDAAKAQEAYTKLITAYPASPWTEMARAGGRLLTWYQSARPDQLMAPIQH